MLIMTFGFVIVFNAFGQTDKKLARTFVKTVNIQEPIEIIEIEANGTKVRLNTPFEGEDVWLDGTVITFRNTSNRTISYVNFALDVREKDAMRFIGGDNIVYGIGPDPKERKRDEPRTLRPGETARLPVPAQSIADIKWLVNKNGKDLKSVSECRIHLAIVAFADGTKWSGGRYQKPDPLNPGKYIPEENNSN